MDHSNPEDANREVPAADAEVKNKVLFKTAGDYAILTAAGAEQERGAAKIILKEEEISFLPDNGKALNIDIREIDQAAADDYRVLMNLKSGAAVEISRLGYQFEDFWRHFSAAWNAVLIDIFLMKEAADKGSARARVLRSGKDLGECQIQFYETSFLVLPRESGLFKIFYGDVDEMKAQDFKIALSAEEENIELSQMGQDFDFCAKAVNAGMTAVLLNAQTQIKEMIPGLDSLGVRQLAEVMRDGRCVAKSRVDSLAPGTWEKIEDFLQVAGMKEEYDYLKSLAGGGEIYAGVKRGAMGSLSGDYAWFLVPLKNNNAIAMEASSEGGSGKATYFFRLVAPLEFEAKKNDLDREVQKTAAAVQKCVRRINFRREPIYLPEEKLQDPKYWKYKFALAQIPELRFLREIFIGRALHRSPEIWRKDVQKLLEFNAAAKDGAKWRADGDDLESPAVPEQNNAQNQNET